MRKSTACCLNTHDTKQKDWVWHLLTGVLIADSGILLIGFGGWDSLDLDSQILICASVSILLIGGLFLISIDAIRQGALRPRPILESKGIYLGRFELNDHYFEAYERQGDNGRKEFRLVSSPPVSPEQEAAFVRYIIHEGLIENLWPKTSKQIEEEASWAFFHKL